MLAVLGSTSGADDSVSAAWHNVGDLFRSSRFPPNADWRGFASAVGPLDFAVRSRIRFRGFRPNWCPQGTTLHGLRHGFLSGSRFNMLHHVEYKKPTTCS